MILTCPECSTSYMAKDDAIGPNGRTVRCAKCSATWFVPAPEVVLSTPDALQLADMTKDAVVENDVTASSPEPGLQAPLPFEAAAAAPPSADVIMRDKADAMKRKARERTIWLIWLIPLLLISAVFIAIYFSRQTIAERFPGTVPFYNALGIEVSANGLKVEQPIMRTVEVNGVTTVVINGVVTNVGKKSLPVPMLTLSLHSPEGQEVATWFVDLEKPMLRPKERLEFISEYPNPPLDSVSLRYSLEQ